MKNMIYGADLGWLTQLESMGYRWLNKSGQEAEAFEVLQEFGVNAVRTRLFVNPLKESFWQKREEERCMLGFCDLQGGIELAKRVKQHGMKFMQTIHYSDHFADPEIQDIPDCWKGHSDTELERDIYEYTKSVMKTYADLNLAPDWVQIGNEINYGMLWPRGSLKENPVQLVRFLNAGYDAVKEVCPDCKVITHLAMVTEEEHCEPFLQNFFANGGKTDILGFSYYPYWQKFESDKDFLLGKLKKYSKEYYRPVMIVETGALEEDDEGAYKIVKDALDAIKEIEGLEEYGVFYWEPEACSEILPDYYPLSAARIVGEKRLQYNKALQAYADDSCGTNG